MLIHEQANRDLAPDATARLRECATIVARVAQQLQDRAKVGDWTAQTEAAAVADQEAKFAEVEAKRARTGLGAPPTSARRIHRDALEAYLRRHPLGGENLVVREARLLPGGRCKLTALVSQEGGTQLPSPFILRQDWQGGATDTSVIAEYALLEQVTAAGIRAPRPLLVERSAAATRRRALHRPRTNARLHFRKSVFTPPRSRTLGLQLAAQVGKRADRLRAFSWLGT